MSNQETERPADALAFVAEVEARRGRDAFWDAVDDGQDPSEIERSDLRALCSIVREREAEIAKWQRASGCANPETMSYVIADFYQRAECRPPLDGIPDGIDRIKTERDALRASLVDHGKAIERYRDRVSAHIAVIAALRERLAKLEAAVRATGKALEGCTLSHPDGITAALIRLEDMRDLVTP